MSHWLLLFHVTNNSSDIQALRDMGCRLVMAAFGIEHHQLISNQRNMMGALRRKRNAVGNKWQLFAIACADAKKITKLFQPPNSGSLIADRFCSGEIKPLVEVGFRAAGCCRFHFFTPLIVVVSARNVSRRRCDADAITRGWKLCLSCSMHGSVVRIGFDCSVVMR